MLHLRATHVHTKRYICGKTNNDILMSDTLPILLRALLFNVIYSIR